MKVLIIGGNRYFGKRLVQLLLGRGDQVTVLNRASLPNLPGVYEIKCNRHDISNLQKLTQDQKWDAIFDQSCSNPSEAEIAVKVFKAKTARYIFTSSQSVYDWGSGLKEGDLDSAYFDIPHKLPKEISYQQSKRLAEAIFFQKLKVPVVAIRFPIVLGVDDYSKRLEFHIERVLKQNPIYFPNIFAQISFITSTDAANFLAFMATSDFTGAINCAAPEPVVLADVMNIIERVVGKTTAFASSEKNGEPSPFGIPENWFMDVSEISKLGFRTEVASKWLPELVSDLARRYLS